MFILYAFYFLRFSCSYCGAITMPVTARIFCILCIYCDFHVIFFVWALHLLVPADPVCRVTSAIFSLISCCHHQECERPSVLHVVCHVCCLYLCEHDENDSRVLHQTSCTLWALFHLPFFSETLVYIPEKSALYDTHCRSMMSLFRLDYRPLLLLLSRLLRVFV